MTEQIISLPESVRSNKLTRWGRALQRTPEKSVTFQPKIDLGNDESEPITLPLSNTALPLLGRALVWLGSRS